MIAWIAQMVMATVGGLFLVYREIKRPNRQRLVMRVIATAVSVFCLVCLIRPLSWKIPDTRAGFDSKPAILLTPGFDPDSLSALQSGKTRMAVYGLQDLHRIDTTITSLHIFGYGLPQGIDPLPNLRNTVLHESPPVKGFVSVTWNQQPAAGEKLNLQGRYVNGSKNQTRIFLHGFSKNLDSMTIPPESEGVIDFETIPAFDGRAVYRLLAVQNGDTIENNPVPVILQKPVKPSILILASVPDFDLRFLQDWLVSNEYPLAMRVRTSKEKTEKRYFGISGLDASRISAALLNSMDIVIADATELVRMGRDEKKVLFEAIATRGVGLIVRSDSLLPAEGIFPQHFKLRKSFTQNPVVLVKTSNDNMPLSVPLSGPLTFIENRQAIKSVIADSSGKMLMGTIKYGAGYIGVSAMPELFSLALSGRRPAYASLWSEILDAVASEYKSKPKIRQLTKLPLINEPMLLEMIAPSDSLPVVKLGNVLIAFAQQPMLPFYSRGTYWPGAQGWQEDLTSAGDTTAIFVYDEADWKNVQLMDRLQHTIQLIKKNNTERVSQNAIAFKTKKIPPVFFYLILTLSLVFLWVEKKFV